MTPEPFFLPSNPDGRSIELRGVRVHNLKNLNLDIPLDQLVVISGVSGSGKSSLAFDTLFREGQRRYIESFSISARKHFERIERPDADRISNVPVAIAIRNERSAGFRPDARSTVGSMAQLLDGLRLLFSRLGQITCPVCNRKVKSQSGLDLVQIISSLPSGTRCQLGFNALLSEGRIPFATYLARGFSRSIWDETTHDLGTHAVSTETKDAWIIVDRFVAGKSTQDRIIESAEIAFREGEGRCQIMFDGGHQDESEAAIVDGRRWNRIRLSRQLECIPCQRQFMPLDARLLSHFSNGACPACRGIGRLNGIPNEASICPACQGTRLREEARVVFLNGRTFPELCRHTSSSILKFINDLDEAIDRRDLRLTDRIRSDLKQRLEAIIDLKLDYLPLDRSADSLSGGEQCRLMLAAVNGSRITGTLVVIDEPSAGLPEAELPCVITALRRVLSLRNSVIVVDHSPQIVLAADHCIELGPAAGPEGGHLMYQGQPTNERVRFPNLLELGSKDTASAAFKKQASNNVIEKLSLTHVHHHNLHNISIDFPLNQLCVVSGPSGSGKTSLIVQVLYPTVCRQLGITCTVSPQVVGKLTGGTSLVDVVLIDQLPLTTSKRSNPATWLNIFDEIRQTFAETSDARQRGFTSQHFSFNSTAGGRCLSCGGTGQMRHDMQFLPDITLVCPECRGTRYRKEILEVKYRGRSIADVLSMSVSEAAVFFRSQPKIQSRFQVVKQIGLDYLVLGQSSETLSGGEAQRLKLAARLVATNRGASLIICDEPTVGLHPKDVVQLVACLRELIANGHSIVVADNSPDLIRAADYLLNLEN